MASRRLAVGDCVRIRDGRIGRVRAIEHGEYRVRVLRRTSPTHQFLVLKAGQLKHVTCPKGWLSPEGYRSYLKPTLAEMRQRQPTKRHAYSPRLDLHQIHYQQGMSLVDRYLIDFRLVPSRSPIQWLSSTMQMRVVTFHNRNSIFH